ncbi:hypothetical protein T265_02378 [Opisthorchis viverrini]|uniref:Uncharacterized protein n=1 Tax=Opisthorchis viverrini TaxID=6198 RepID=A0A075A6P6_OPIVI|nr:hypothetical protein T265_02378 [Opisthorchis viverrini]KER31320.1 hypothetical protein T265_02378 [Opisthorchis viverrini]
MMRIPTRAVKDRVFEVLSKILGILTQAKLDKSDLSASHVATFYNGLALHWKNMEQVIYRNIRKDSKEFGRCWSPRATEHQNSSPALISVQEGGFGAANPLCYRSQSNFFFTQSDS